MKERDNPIWSAGANLMVPLFRGGALKTQVEIRTAEQRQAVAEYVAVGVRAFGDVENALSAERAARDRERLLTATLADSQRALDLTQTSFRIGSARSARGRATAARAGRHALGAHPRAGRTAPPAREPASGPRRPLRAAPATPPAPGTSGPTGTEQ